MMAIEMSVWPILSLHHNHEIPFRRAIKNRDMKKHNAPPETHIPEKKLGRHHINDDVSNAPAIGVPNSSNKFHLKSSSEWTEKSLPIKPPIPVKQFSYTV